MTQNASSNREVVWAKLILIYLVGWCVTAIALYVFSPMTLRRMIGVSSWPYWVTALWASVGASTGELYILWLRTESKQRSSLGNVNRYFLAPLAGLVLGLALSGGLGYFLPLIFWRHAPTLVDFSGGFLLLLALFTGLQWERVVQWLGAAIRRRLSRE